MARPVPEVLIVLLVLFIALPLTNIFCDPPPVAPTTAAKPKDKPEPAKEAQP